MANISGLKKMIVMMVVEIVERKLQREFQNAKFAQTNKKKFPNETFKPLFTSLGKKILKKNRDKNVRTNMLK